MEIVSDMSGVVLTGAESGGDSGGSFLVTPELGLMIWTVIAFLFTMWVLSKAAFPRIREMLEERASKINSDIDAAAQTRKDAEELLEEYRARLKEAREQAEDILARAKKSGESTKADSIEEGRAKREELLASAKKDIEAETRRSLEQIRKEIADLTVLATERVTRKSLSEDDQKRLVEEALGEVDFSALAGNAKE